ncbi:MAG: IPT/TIG domain-containing protein [Planctomycetes bacterium]|nr:IPT/TIG domain-containing protein [Planctomycetota bacterium]MBI3847054.1 IPT/TIG domain-containing protein [Planctomycetota bacterium]
MSIVRGALLAAVAITGAAAARAASDDAVAVWQHRDASTGGWDVFYSVLEVNSFAGLEWHANGSDLVDPVSSLPGDDVNPAVAFAPTGGALAVWEHDTENAAITTDIWYSVFDGSTWSGALPIATLAGDDSDPAIAFDTDGTAFAIWVHDDAVRKVIYTSRWDGSMWTLAAPINPVPGTWPGQAAIPELAFTSQASIVGGTTVHRAVAIWSDLSFGVSQSRVFFSAWNGVTWTPNQPIPVSGGRAFEVASDPFSRLGLAAGPAGNTIATWGGEATSALIASPGIAGASFDGASWTGVSTSAGGDKLALDRAHSPAISTDGVGGFVVGYSLDGFLEWNSNLGTSFTTEDILGGTGGVDTRIALCPIKSGVLATWWSQGGAFPPSDIFYASYDPDTRLWTAPAVQSTPAGLDGDDENPSVSSFLSTVAPRLARVSPHHGPEAGNTFVVLTGWQFANGGAPTIRFGANLATNVQVIDDQTITCRTPAGVDLVDVTISNANGSNVLRNAYNYDDRPTPLTIAPQYGPENVGTNVTISGFGFVDRIHSISVTFGGVTATNIVVVNDNQITCTTPASAESTVDVVVSNQNGMGTLAGAYRFLGPEILCRPGNVNAGAGPITPTLFVNGSFGNEPDRIVTVGVRQPVTISMGLPPSRSTSKYCFYAYHGVATRSTVTEQSHNGISLGTGCLPTPFTGGSPQPLKILNQLRHEPLLGTSNLPDAPPAPGTIFRLNGGATHPITGSLFAFIRDDAAANPNGFSITNLVELHIQ